jgi:hypothetical protein
MGVIQEIAPDPGQALEAALAIASKIAACGPLGIKTTLASAQLSIDESEAAAFSRLSIRPKISSKAGRRKPKVGRRPTMAARAACKAFSFPAPSAPRVFATSPGTVYSAVLIRKHAVLERRRADAPFLRFRLF